MRTDGDLDVPLPADLLETLVTSVRDVAEIKVVLAVETLAASPAWRGRPIPEDAVCDDPALRRGLRAVGSSREPTDEIRRGIDLAAARDILLRFVTTGPEATNVWVLPANAENRRMLARLEGGAELPAAWNLSPQPTRVEKAKPNVFALYEQNIGLITPIIADQLIEALESFPERWIEDAITEAVSYNRRNWRYIQRILVRWVTEGRSDEAGKRDSSGSQSLDREKYLRGKYATLFRQRQ